MRRMTVHKTQNERPDEGPDQLREMTEVSVEDQLAPVTNLRPTVGDDLRRRREEAGESLDEVAEAVRIQKRFLQALEEGRIDELPGTVYALGFLRTYAEHYGLNGDEFVARFKEETEGKRQEQDYTLPEPIEDARVPTAAMFILAILLAVGAYVAWYNFWPEDLDITAAVPEVPADLASVDNQSSPAPDVAPIQLPEQPPEPVVEAPAEPESLPPQPLGEEQPVLGPSTPAVVDEDTPAAFEAPPPPEPSESATTEEMPAPPQTEPSPSAEAAATEPPPAGEELAIASPPEVSEPTEPPAAELEEPVHEPQTYGIGNADSRILISAVEDSWIEVTDSEGNRLLSRTLRTGDSYRVPDQEGLVFVTGNAGGLEITVDGVSVPSLGDTGIVRKNVKLDPELLREGRAWP